MRLVLFLFVLSALASASPAMAGEKSTRTAGEDEVAAAASNQAAPPGDSDRDERARCTCAPQRESTETANASRAGRAWPGED